MGQVLGFSHCKEFGSVSSTPDSTPPCTDGGNEESDFPELITAREWSEDEEGPEDDDGGLSSPSVWGTPRQNSFELTFSYIAFSEGEGSSRRDSGRRRAGGRGRRGSLHRVDTVETLLPPDSPTVEWDPHAFMSGEGELEAGQIGELPEPTESIDRTLEPPRQDIEETSDKDTGTPGEVGEISGSQTYCVTESLQTQQLHGSEPPVTTETMATSQTEDTSRLTPPLIGQNTQEELTRERWISTLDLSEGPTIHIHIAVSLSSLLGAGMIDQCYFWPVGRGAVDSTGQKQLQGPRLIRGTERWQESAHPPAASRMASKVMDLIYWKDTERTGMVFTGLVVGLLSLFQLSIITVVSTLSLAIMCFTLSIRIYCKVLHALQLRDSAHPFKSYLDMDIGLIGEQADHYMQRVIVMICSAVDTLKRLIFVGNLFDSLKFLLLMYLVTYLGALCNGLTLLIIGVIVVFSVPLFYTRHQEKVDTILATVQAHIDNIKDILTRLAQGGGPPSDPTPGGAKPKSQ
ncbi:reticulon-2a [Colossoma macropomum]|uniref:reticulon-2a n=1 Tax=Colossoma macropomum TaxID=42526 RepID=UPI0018655FE3|nr:reticulon-2a [Colossoma macropomum]